MTHTHDTYSLSPVQQIILARISGRTPPKPSVFTRDVTEVALSRELPDRASHAISEALAELRHRGLIDTRQLKLTKEGKSALRETFAVKRVPTWNQVCARLSARPLGLQPDSPQAQQALKTKDSIAIAVVRQRANLPAGFKLDAVCDSLIAEVLGLPPGKITLQRIRAHVLARRVGAASKDEPHRVAADLISATDTDTASMSRALARKGLGAEDLPPAASALPAYQTVAPDDLGLLALVREAIPHIGSDGRVGSEKVFVSAIWKRITIDRRASNLSLDHFKQWLVSANRNQLIALERADAVGGMDARLVAESEIKSLGTTFHFVLDHQGPSVQGQNNHVR